MDNRELAHYGIKGMKWGVRRYQTKNGALTPAGKKRYKNSAADDTSSLSNQELRARINRMNLEKRYGTLSKGDSGRMSKALGAGEKIASIGSSASKNVKNIRKLQGRESPGATVASQGSKLVTSGVTIARDINRITSDKKNAKRNRTKLSTMSDKDLQELVERMDLEQQYSSLKRETISRGKTTVADVLDIAGDVLAIGASATAIAVGIQKLRS